MSIPYPASGMDQGRAFYGEVFGLEEIPTPATLDSGRLAWFSLGNQELHLYVDNEGAAPRNAQHFCCEVDDLDEVRERIESGGYTIEEAVEIHNRPRLFCFDPAGNRVEVTQIQGQYR